MTIKSAIYSKIKQFYLVYVVFNKRKTTDKRKTTETFFDFKVSSNSLY